MSFILRIGFGAIFACWFLVQSAFAVNVSSFSPGFGAPGDFITIRGSGFYPGVLAVYFGAARDFSAQATAADGTVIIATVPAGATTGPITVMVDTVGNAGSSLEDFTVIGPGPYVSGFSPAVGSGGTLVLVDGAHFSVGTGLQVTFNGVLGTGVFAQSDTRLQVNAPAGVTTGPIRVSSLLAHTTLAGVLRKARIWEKINMSTINDRQRLVVNRLLDGFEGNLTSSKYAKLAHCSADTALRDIRELLERGTLMLNPSRGRSTSYRLSE